MVPTTSRIALVAVEAALVFSVAAVATPLVVASKIVVPSVGVGGRSRCRKLLWTAKSSVLNISTCSDAKLASVASAAAAAASTAEGSLRANFPCLSFIFFRRCCFLSFLFSSAVIAALKTAAIDDDDDVMPL
jgi:hypothetical protein